MEAFKVNCPCCCCLHFDKKKFCEECGCKLNPSLWKAVKDTQTCDGCCIVYPISQSFCINCGIKNPTHGNTMKKDKAKLQSSKNTARKESYSEFEVCKNEPAWPEYSAKETYTNTSTAKRGKLENGHVLMDYKLAVPKQLLAGGRQLMYTYICMHHNLSTEVEFFFTGTKYSAASDCKRILCIPLTECDYLDVWHQYDGIMYRQPLRQSFMSQISQIFSLSDKLKEETKIAAVAMLPNWSGFCLDEESDRNLAAHDLIKQVIQVEYCMKNQFAYMQHDKSQFKQVLLSYIEPRLQKLQDQHITQSETDEEAILRLAASMTIVWLCVKYQLDYQKNNIAKAVLFGLRLTPKREKNSCIEYETLVKYHFPGLTVQAGNYLEEFLKKMVIPYGFCETNWLTAVPLYHFLKNLSQPYVPLKHSSRHKDVVWWGVGGLQKTVTTFRNLMEMGDKLPLQYYFQILGPLFGMDHLLSRTLLAVLTFEKHIENALQYDSIESTVFIAYFYYSISSQKIFDKNHLKMLKSYLELLQVKITKESDNIQTVSTNFQQKGEECDSEISIAVDFFEQILQKCKHTDQHEVIQYATFSVLGFIHKYQVVFNVATQSKHDGLKLAKMRKSIEQYTQKVANRIADWLKQTLPSDMLQSNHNATSMRNHNELKIFSWIVSINILSEDLSGWWKDFFMKLLTDRVDQVTCSSRKVEVFCTENFSEYNPLVEEQFRKTALNIIKDGVLDNLNFMHLHDSDNGRELLSRMFQTVWPDEEDHSAVLDHMLTWTPFVSYLEIVYNRSTISKNMLSEKIQSQVTNGVSLLQTTWDKFTNGSIQLQFLKVIIDKFQSFEKICEVLQRTEDVGDDDDDDGIDYHTQLTEINEYRKAEVQMYESQCWKLARFLDFCKLVEAVDCDNLSNELSMDTDGIKLDSICKPQLYGSGIPDPYITCFSVSPDVINILDDFCQMKDSFTFVQRWNFHGCRLIGKKQIDEVECDKISLDEVVEYVWSQTLADVKDIYKKLNSGAMTFIQVEETFGCFKQNYKEISNEIANICKGLNVPFSDYFGKRINQIEQYYVLCGHKQAVMTMKKIRRGFNLSGEFKVLELLINIVEEKTVTLFEFTEKAMKSCETLKELDETKGHSIEVFQKSLPILELLKLFVKGNSQLHQVTRRGSVPKKLHSADIITLQKLHRFFQASGTSEVKALIDLAKLSRKDGNDEDVPEVAQVSYLYDAITGYAPLIYELRPDAGYKELLRQCQQVWKAVDADPELPRKLEETTRLCYWLKDIKEYVEVGQCSNDERKDVDIVTTKVEDSGQMLPSKDLGNSSTTYDNIENQNEALFLNTQSEERSCHICNRKEGISLWLRCGWTNPQTGIKDCNFYVHQSCIHIYCDNAHSLELIPLFCPTHAPKA